MTISYVLGFNPKWYFADLTGLPLGNGTMYTYDSLNPTSQKLVFQDPAGAIPYPDPVVIDMNGTAGPFYFEFDSTDPSSLYYIEVYDSNGVLQWTINNYDGGGSGGGGGTVTTALNLNNLVSNSIMLNHGNGFTSPVVSALNISPGAHVGLAVTTSNAWPDVTFFKSNTSATDSITFPTFILGSSPFTGDVTTYDYCRYTCTGAGTAETYKYFQFPITSKSQNLSNQNVVVTIWARLDSDGGNADCSLSFFQFYGDGPSASASQIVTIGTFTATTSWIKYTFTTTVPNAVGNSLGECGNDGLFIQVNMPLSATTDIDFTKVCCYLGNIAPTEEYETYDFIASEIYSPRTGDIKTTANFYEYGYVPLVDGETIGSASSGATARAYFDTFPLYNLIWNNSVGNQSVAPMQNSAGTPIAYGSSSVADFSANNRLTLYTSLDRAILGSVPGDAIPGLITGSPTVTLTTANLPAHNHPGSVMPYATVLATTSGAGATVVAPLGTPVNSYPLAVASQGTATPVPITSASVYMYRLIKL